ncbi:hypothetical protein BDW62DRAFT_209521 [Aspergillus aurantiobrunneus]
MFGLPATPRPRVRRWAKRSKTGCRTCRVRHVKCDETPIACRMCTSTGRRCDGYDVQRLPQGRKQSTNLQPGPGKMVDWAMTSDERQCFSYFHGRTTPTLLQFFDSTLWQNLVLQQSRYEPPVYHAIIALGVIHRNSEADGMQLATPAGITGIRAEDVWHRFAQDQLGRSITLLNRRCLSQDLYVREVVLVCCLLFILADFLRGRYDDAFRHLHAGLRILNELQAPNGAYNAVSGRSLVEQCLVSAFGHLDILAAHYDLQLYSRPHFRSLPEVRSAFDTVLRASYRLSSQCLGMSDVEIALNYATLQAQKLEIWSQMANFKQLFEPFCAEYYARQSQKEQRGLDTIKLHLLSTPTSLKGLLLRSNRAPLAYYTSDLAAICSITEKIIGGFSERPSVTGPFDSNWVAFLAEERLRVELEARCDEDPAFRETIYSVRSDQFSADRILQRQRLERFHSTKRLGNTLGDPSSPVSGPFTDFKGMQNWSCVRSFMLATSRIKKVSGSKHEINPITP